MRRCLAALVTLCLTAPLSAVHVDDSTFDRTPRDAEPAVTAARLAAPPTIDGDLSDDCWQHAALIKSFWLAGTDKTATDQTLAWIGFDKDNLYIAYACQDKKVTGLGAFPRDDKQIYGHDSVEVHLMPARDPGKTYQFILGAGGSQFDLDKSLGKFTQQLTWNADWKSAVKIQPYGYSAEIAIPLAAVSDPAKFDVARGTWWKIKLTRSDFGATGGTGGTGGEGIRLSSWTRMGVNTSDTFAIGDLYFEDRNLLANGSAETWVDGQPVDWEIAANNVDVKSTPSTESPTDGKQSACFELRGPIQPNMNTRVYASRTTKHRQPIETTYRFSADVRVQAEPRALVAYFVVFNGQDISQIKIDQNKPWQHVEALVTVEPGKSTEIPCIQAVPTANEGVKNPGGFIYLDNLRFEAVETADATGDPTALCLTGNAFGPQRTRNGRVAGSYSYFEPGTESPQFPDYLQNEKPPEKFTYSGWIPFTQGLLTDGQTFSAVQWGQFWSGPRGHDIVFDLGAAHTITRVVLLGGRIGYGQVWLKSSQVAGARYLLAASNWTQYDFNMGTLTEQPQDECVLNVPPQSARWVRVQIPRTASPAEIQIWGKPVTAEAAAAPPPQPLLQNQGRTSIAAPQSRPLVYKDVPPVFPIPQEIKLQGAPLTLRDGMKIAYDPTGGDRARITAEVLADELQTCYGLQLTVIAANSGGASGGDIVLAENADAPPKLDAYSLRNDGQRIVIHGHNPRGTFYGTQTLLSLIRLSDSDAWEVPGADIRDWPDMPVRYIQGRPIPDKNLVRALARFRVTHYESQPRYTAQAAQWDKEAQRYFVQFVPELSFSRVVLEKDEQLTERAPDEDLKTVERGRRNANPAHARSWEIYEAEVKKWLSQFHGDFVHIVYDETYQTQGGSRWNVSAESRALKLSAGDLIAYQLNRIDKLFKQYGKTIVMHDTAFMSNHTLSYVGDPDPSWLKAIPKLPKDIKFLVWHPKDAAPLLHAAGHELFWLEVDEADWRKRDFPNLYQGITAYMAESAFTPAKLIGLVGVAWNLRAPRPNDALANMTTAKYIPVWRELHESMRPPSRYATTKDFTPLDIHAAANRSRLDKVAYDGQGFVDMGPNVDLRALPAGLQEFAGIPFQIIDESKTPAGKTESNFGGSIVMIHNRGDVDRSLPSDLTIDIADVKAASLLFLHNLENRPGHNYLRRKELAGFYIMEYADGSYSKHEIKYAVNTANWDGRPVNAGYNPKGHEMTDGFLAWEGDTTSGMPAYLYATEWTNPCPDKTITKIHLRSPYNIADFNPMLYAVTAVHPRRAAKLDPAAPAPVLPPITRFAEPSPSGTLYDLSGGKDESEIRYLAPDGTVISCPNINNITANYVRWDAIEYRSCVSMVNADGNYSTARTGQVDYAFPQPTSLAGILLTGGFRRERKTENFEPTLQDYQLEVSTDQGKTWTLAAAIEKTSPEEHGPQWLPCPDAPLTNLRVTVKALTTTSDGIQRIQLFKK